MQSWILPNFSLFPFFLWKRRIRRKQQCWRGHLSTLWRNQHRMRWRLYFHPSSIFSARARNHHLASFDNHSPLLGEWNNLYHYDSYQHSCVHRNANQLLVRHGTSRRSDHCYICCGAECYAPTIRAEPARKRGNFSAIGTQLLFRFPTGTYNLVYHGGASLFPWLVSRHNPAAANDTHIYFLVCTKIYLFQHVRHGIAAYVYFKLWHT